MIREQFRLLLDNELVVDLFAGGGGMSTAIEHALGRAPDIAINHNADALSLHQANHPQTAHYIADVYEVDPHEVSNGVPIGYLHLSPDCTHHSQAAGGQPRSKKIRGLAWVGFRWGGMSKRQKEQNNPRIISLENVKQILQWGPLIAKRDKETGRVVKLDGTVAAQGERVPVNEQFLIPDPKRAGQTWRKFVRSLESLGYVVEWRTIVAADYGAATTRERLFMWARRDGQPIVWPKETHSKNPAKGQKKHEAAANHIDWSIPCPSIFTRKKPLADATMRRIAKGMQKFVLTSADPFIVPIAHYNGSEPVHSTAESLRTITASPKGGSFALCAPTLVQAGHGDGKPGGVKRWGDGAKSIKGPVNTITASGGGQALATAFLAQANGGFNETIGRTPTDPVTTITTTGSQQQLVMAHLMRQFGQSIGQSCSDSAPTIMATGGGKTALVEYTLSQDQEEGALRCAAFLACYYGTDNMHDVRDPLATITTRDRLALVTVWIKGDPWVIVDIGLRMLTPPELYRCQGFPANYIIDRGHDGRVFTKADQVRMVGNSVSPPPATAMVRANCMDLAVWSRKEIKQLEAA